MSRTLRIALMAAGVLIVLLIALPFLIPVNQFRPTIEAKASQALGRKVSVGDLSLSLLGGALTAKDLSIGDDPKFSSSPFLTAKSLSVGVELMPLIFSKQLNVTGIAIDDPEVTLLRNPAGDWNYSSIGSSSEPRPKTDEKPSSGKSTPSASSTPDISVKKLELKNGKINIGTTKAQQRTTYDHVNVTASDFSLSTKFPVTVTAKLPGGGDMKLDGKVGPLDRADTTLTPLDAKLQVSALNLATT